MKKVFFRTMVRAIFVGSVVSSCVSDIEDLYEPEYTAKKQQYETQWRIKFGRIDPNEDWGFGVDSVNVTRATNKEVHMWNSLGLIPPAEVTEDEIERVNAYLKDTENLVALPILNLSDFWMQQVSSTEYGKSYLNQLHVLTTSGNEDLSLDSNGGETKTVYMENSGSVGFYCYSSYAGRKIEEYVVVEIDGSYYVGLEFYDEKEDNGLKTIGGDGIYNDWVIKLTPVEYPNSKRIICEDLGTIGDFDFNDVVFDVCDLGWRDDTTEGTVREALVTIHAAGGTLPIYIGGVEVHAALGVEPGVMVNTGAPNGVNAPIANFRVRMKEDVDVTSIPVTVESAEAGFYTLEAPQGKAPQKICVSTDFQWTTERTDIKDAYESFPSAGWENTTGNGEFLY